MNDSTYEEKWGFRLSMMNLYTLLAFYTIIIVFLIIVLFRYTPLQGLISSSVGDSSWEQVEENSQSLDSLYTKIESNEKYLNNLMMILNDDPFDDSLYQMEDSLITEYQPDFETSSEDSILRNKMENVGDAYSTQEQSSLGFFFPPVNGEVSKSFNLKENHRGVDVATKKDEAIKTCLDGTIIFAGWSASDGNVVMVQHSSDLVSIYKHCSVLLKSQGDKVQEGDPIAIVGNSGEYSSGTHLHFELWKNGNPINPQEFISF